MERIRQRWPGAAIRTTLLAGYPGETDRDFETLLTFVRQFRFEHLGAFTFSPEQGTRAARITAGLVPPELAAERRARLLEAQRELCVERNAERAGQTVKVLVDHPEGRRRFAGRTAADAPDVDGVVHFRGPADSLAQGFVHVRIERADAYDLYGRVVE